MKSSIRWLSMFMSIVMFTYMLNLPVLAEEAAFEDEVVSESMAEFTAENEVVSDDSSGEKADSEEPYVLIELEDRREESIKHFLMSDHTVQAIIYGQPMHYLEGNEWVSIDNSLQYDQQAFDTSGGYINANNDFLVKFAPETGLDEFVSVQYREYSLDWKYIEPDAVVTPVDPELDIMNEEEASLEHEENYNLIESASSNNAEDSVQDKPDIQEESQTGVSDIAEEDISVTTEFSDNILPDTEPSEVSLSDKVVEIDAKNLRRVPISIENSEAMNVSTYGLIDNSISRKNLEETVSDLIENTCTEVVYEEALLDTDFQYQITGKTLKENIIVHQQQEDYIYRFQMKTQGLQLAVNENTAEIYAFNPNTEEKIFCIPAPVMFDAANACSSDVAYDLSQIDTDLYMLTITANAEWINSDERVFPVSIDPVITTIDMDSLSTTFVASWTPNTIYQNAEWVMGFEESEYGECRGLLQFPLPDLNPGDMVIEAQMRMVMVYRSAASNSTPLELDAYLVTESWTKGTVTWNTQPDTADEVYDYFLVTSDDMPNDTSGYGTAKYTDLTKAVREWYEGTPNYGVMIKTADTSVYTKARFISERSSAYGSEYWPYIAISYRNNKGIEPYWGYTTASAGTAGDLAVNDFSGNAVLTHTDAATSGLLMPMSISHVYNGYLAGHNFTYDLSKKMMPYSGKGWKLNVQQMVRSSAIYGLTDESLETWPYVYTDGDGTEHYFMLTDDNKYLDEDGLGLELKVTSSGYTIEDDQDNCMTFNSIGNLTKIEDANGNAATITYDSNGFITKITDGAGHTITLANNGTYLTSITDPGGKTTNYTYSSGLLTKITYSDGTYSTYTYDSDNALVSAKSKSGAKIQLSYTLLDTGKRVSVVEEYGTEGSVGQKIEMDRTQHNTTILKSGGIDGELGTTDDLITTIHFDNAGRTTDTQISTVGGEQLGSTYAELTKAEPNSSGSNIKTLNRISREATIGQYSNNVAKGSSFETLTNWTSTATGSAVQTAAVSAEESYSGVKALKLTTTSCPSGSAGRTRQSLSSSILEPGETYTASVYTKIPEDMTFTGSSSDLWGGAALQVVLNSNTVKYSEFIDAKTDTDINNGWRRLSVTFTVPKDSTSTTIGMVISNAVGTAYFDALQIEKGNAANPYNILVNSGFELGSTSSWTATSASSADSVSTSVKHSGSYSYKITGDADTKKALTQSVSITGTEFDTYILSAWANLAAVPDRNDEREIKAEVVITYSDNTTVKKKAQFNQTVDGWQHLIYAFSLQDPDNAGKTPAKLTIRLCSENQVGYVYFDDIQLLKDESQSYTYDDDGNLISVVKNAEEKGTMKYSNGNLIQETDAKGYSFSYTYDANHNLTQAISQNKVEYNYTYDSNGNPTSLRIKDNAKTAEVRTDVTYNAAADGIAAGAYVEYEIDAHGKVGALYDYDLQTGLLQTAMDGRGIRTTYGYDSNDRLISVSRGDTTIEYGYNNNTNLLTEIEHNGFSYTFAYDVFGNRTQTKAGDSILATYAYGAKNGVLQSVTYGNGFKIGYSYDVAGRVTGKSYNDELRYTWKYGSSGEALEHVDIANNNLVHTYDYDSTGRYIRERAVDDTQHLYTVEYGYDVMNNVTKIAHETYGSTVTQNYTYGKDNLPTKYQNSLSLTVNYGYDGLNRLTTQTIPAANPIVTTLEYEDSERGDGYTTNLVESETIGGVTYRYTRNAVGNITQVEESTDGTTFTTTEHYRYDSNNQLVFESNAHAALTREYTYDKGGNIAEIKERDRFIGPDELSIEAPLLGGTNGVRIIGYRYSTSGWADLLTSYNSTGTIEYDEIGNPLTYRDGMTLTWEGRQLKTLVKDGTTSTYTYDADGLRTKKTVGSIATAYQYVGGQLLRERRSNGVVLRYAYDALGNLATIQYTNVDNWTRTFYVRTKLNGDVDQIYDTSGNLIAKYTYDAWGSTISITDADGKAITASTHVAVVNPIRYRGYYWDAETGFYYLQSRYYDPETKRFLNADEVLGANAGAAFNLYAYCGNDPINMIDASGMYPVSDDPYDMDRLFPEGYRVDFSKKYTNRPDSGLVNVSDEEVQRKARDRSLSGKERNRYKEEEKVRGLRNKQKRTNHFSSERVGQIALGIGIVVVATAGIIFVSVNDATGIGVADDFLLAPLGAGIGKGIVLIFA